MSAALVLKSAQEFRHWLLTMVQFLLQQGKQMHIFEFVLDFGERISDIDKFAGESRRLRLICEELLGPFHKYAKNPGQILVSF
jgi:hypothetical protein